MLQVKRAVHEAMAFYWTDLKQSDQNQTVTKSSVVPFVADTYVYNISTIIDPFSFPAWVEIQIGSDTSFDWQVVTVCNRDALLQFRDRGDLACSFYGSFSHNTVTDTIEWSALPVGADGSVRNFRIWYDPSIAIASDPLLTTGFPPDFNYLLALAAKIKLIPECKAIDIQDAKENETDKFILQASMGMWSDRLGQFLMEKQEWDKKWRFYKLNARGQQGSRRKRRIDPRYL